MQFAACIEWMFTSAGPGLPERIRAAGAAGIKSVEFHLWRGQPLDAIGAALAESGVALRSFCVDPRFSLVDPAEHAQLLDAVRDAIPVAQRFGQPGMVLASGFTRAGVDTGEQFDAAVTVLRQAAALAQEAGVKLWLEPVHMVLHGQRMFVDTIGRGLDLVEAVGSPALRLLADVYHAAQSGEDLAQAFGSRMALVAHVQVADTPGRNEPGSGTLDWPGLMALLREQGYRGEIGLEYFPTMGDAASLEHTRRALGLAG